MRRSISAILPLTRAEFTPLLSNTYLQTGPYLREIDFRAQTLGIDLVSVFCCTDDARFIQFVSGTAVHAT